MTIKFSAENTNTTIFVIVYLPKGVKAPKQKKFTSYEKLQKYLEPLNP